MTREIKFRAWCEGEHDTLLFAGPHMKHNILVGPNGGYVSSSPAESSETGYNFMDNDEYPTVPIMQYTGLKDKNEVDIYEGDIIQQRAPKLSNSNKIQHTHVVEYCEHTFELSHASGTVGGGFDFGDCWCLEDIEVIGNIYQNPDLIK